MYMLEYLYLITEFKNKGRIKVTYIPRGAAASSVSNGLNDLKPEVVKKSRDPPNVKQGP